MSAVAAARPPGRRKRSAAAAVVAAGGADRAGRRAAPGHAGPAELLVRRGLHAGARPAQRPRGDAAGVVHHENTPPLWYLIAWADVRLFGDGALALRLPSALAGILTVPVVWAIGQQLAGRRAALIAAAIVAVNPLFVWYSQEARAYGLFVLMSALAMLCFVRALHEPTPRAHGGLRARRRAGAADALLRRVPAGSDGAVAACATERSAGRRSRPSAALAVVGLALLPLISAQGGHGTQWIGRWALSSRLQAIPQYYLTGYSGAPLGHGVELLVALPILAGAALGAWRLSARRPRADTAAAQTPGAPPALAGVARLRRAGADRALDRRLRRARADRARGLRRGLPRAAQPRRRDDPAERADRHAARRRRYRAIRAARRARGDLRAASPRRGARRDDRRRLRDRVRRRRPQPAPAARQLARRRARARRGLRREGRSRPSSSAPRRSSTTCRRCTTSPATRACA